MPDFLRNARHLVHALLPGRAGAVDTMRELVRIVAEAGNFPNKFRVVDAGAGMDFLARNERAQVFLAVQTAGRTLPIQKQ